MKKLLFTLFIMLMFFSVAKAEFVNNIVVNGNERVSAETVILLGEVEKDKEYTDTILNHIINELYKTNFFSDIKLEILNGTLNIEVTENKGFMELFYDAQETNNEEWEAKVQKYRDQGLGEKRSKFKASTKMLQTDKHEFLIRLKKFLRILYSMQDTNAYGKIIKSIDKLRDSDVELCKAINEGVEKKVHLLNPLFQVKEELSDSESDNATDSDHNSDDNSNGDDES